MDVSTNHLAMQMNELTAAYDELRADCLKAAQLYGERMYIDDFPEVVTACSDIAEHEDETPEELSIMFDDAFIAFSALASQIERDKPEWSSEDPRGVELPVYVPEEEWLGAVTERVEDYRAYVGWERRFTRARAQVQAEAMGYVGHPLFRANARNTSKGILVSAMQSALRDGKWHFGEFATFQWQQLWRFDVFPGNASRAWQKDLGAEMEAWSRAGSETDTQPMDGLFDCTYVDGEGTVREGLCWVRIAFKASTMTTVMTVAGPVRQVGFGLHETDQYNDKAGKEMQQARYRE